MIFDCYKEGFAAVMTLLQLDYILWDYGNFIGWLALAFFKFRVLECGVIPVHFNLRFTLLSLNLNWKH